jgi:magnesium-protoporphyrin O-methyltransferase
MNRQHCCGIEKTFNSRLAERELQDYRAHGPGRSTHLLIEALKAAGIEGLTLLDIGGGVGAVQHELLKAGVNRAISIDASSAYLQASRQEAERQGHAQRVTYQHGNFVELAPQLPPVDIVTLDKVICCYPDMRALVGLSSARAARLYGVIFPRDTWWMRTGGWVENLFWRLQHNSFHFFVHPAPDIDSVVRANGLELRYDRKTPIWQVMIYAR